MLWLSAKTMSKTLSKERAMKITLKTIEDRIYLLVDGQIITSFARMADIPAKWRKMAGK